MFTLLNSKKVDKLNIEIFEYIHDKTKAKHIHIKADDKNNGFCCAFRTLPYSSNGIMHILEHCVLQGSKDFPLKDVFTSMGKNSLNTFMNAMTGSSYTLYPFTSQTEKDYFNLMHVYTNTVFFPLLEKEAFLQEGWRYEFTEPKDKTSDIKVNGVVYNEMIGAFASPYRYVWASVAENLYPDTIFRHDSGGAPKNIPDLTYEEFVAYHKKFYHPSNANFITYGDIPIEIQQEKLEELVLKHFDYKEISLEGVIQEPFVAPRAVEVTYPYKEEDFNEKNFFIKAISVTDFENLSDMFTVDFLMSLIAADSSSILKNNIEKSKLAKNSFAFSADTNSKYDVLIVCEGVKSEDIDALNKIINDTLESIVENGFDEKVIKKELHHFELSQRTRYHRSNNLAFDLIDKATDCAFYNVDINALIDPMDLFEEFKQNIQNPEFLKNFVKEKIINQPHQVDIKLLASNEKAEQEDKALADVAANKQATLTAEDRQAILDDVIALEEYQNRVDPEGVLPELKVSDISRDFKIKKLETVEKNGKTIHAFAAPTSGVTLYAKHAYLKDIKASQAPYLNLYTTYFNVLGYNGMSYEEAAIFETNISDGITASISFTEDRYDPEKIYTRFTVATKMLRENIEEVKKALNEKVKSLRLDEKDKIINEVKKLSNHYSSSYFNRGHTVAIDIAKAHISKIDNFSLAHDGIEYMTFLKDLADNIDNNDVYDNFIEQLELVNQQVIKSFDDVIISVLDSKEDLAESVDLLFEDNIVDNIVKHPMIFDLEAYDKQVVTSSKTTANYCAMVAKAPYLDHELSGALAVLFKIVDGDYSHIYIREKGGAYGGMASYNPHNEVFAIASYRDPNISKTFDVCKNLTQWLENLEVTDKQLEEGILQSMSSVDMPLTEISKCSRALARFFDEVNDDEIINYRNKLLSTTKEQIKQAIDEIVLPALKDSVFTAVVNKKQFENEKISMNTIEF